jgi:hypothetical protein
MELLVVILLVLAVALFLAAAFVRSIDPPRFNFLALGLAVFAFAFLVPAYEAVRT